MNINAGTNQYNLSLKKMKEEKRPTFATIFDKLDARSKKLNPKNPLNAVMTNDQMYRYYLEETEPMLREIPDDYDLLDDVIGGKSLKDMKLSEFAKLLSGNLDSDRNVKYETLVATISPTPAAPIVPSMISIASPPTPPASSASAPASSAPPPSAPLIPAPSSSVASSIAAPVAVSGLVPGSSAGTGSAPVAASTPAATGSAPAATGSAAPAPAPAAAPAPAPAAPAPAAEDKPAEEKSAEEKPAEKAEAAPAIVKIDTENAVTFSNYDDVYEEGANGPEMRYTPKGEDDDEDEGPSDGMLEIDEASARGLDDSDAIDLDAPVAPIVIPVPPALKKATIDDDCEMLE